MSTVYKYFKNIYNSVIFMWITGVKLMNLCKKLILNIFAYIAILYRT